MRQYIVVEQQTNTLSKLFSGQFKQPRVEYLFDNTEFAACKAKSPLFVQDAYTDLATLHSFLQKQSGILISSNYPTQDLLKHLQHILIVYASHEQKALFRYYDPYIASYFFNSLQKEEINDWMGPIERIEWFNVSWRDRANEPDKWQQFVNQELTNKSWQVNEEVLSSTLMLKPHHHKALEEMQLEKYAYNWQTNVQKNTQNINIDQTIKWTKEGINDGFDEPDVLSQYLQIRAKHQLKKPPTNWPTENLADRLIYLNYHLSNAIA